MSAEKKAKRGRTGHTGRSRRSEEHDMPSHEASSSQGFAPINFTTPQPGVSSRPSAHSSRLEQGNRVNIASASGGGPLERSPSTSTQGPPGKIAIPAIRREIESAAKRQERKIRTSHACENCRKAKAGCSGEQPCSRCRNGRLQCVYGDGKRDKERKRISKLSRDAEILSQHAAEVNDAIRRIRDDDQLSSEDMRAALDGVMRMTPRPLSPDDGDVSASGFERDDAHSNNEEFDTNAEAGSTGSLDVIEIDADKDDTRATGHMGKSSSVAWAKRTAMELSASDSLLGRKEAGHTIASYHTEDADVENVDTSGTNPYEWPDTRASECLIDIYFEHVHPVFPVLDKASFLEEYNTFPRNSADLSRGQKIWLGSLNTVWAISAVYARLAKRQDYQGPHHEHLFFVERAKMLSKETDVLYEDARIGTVLSLALLCLYYIGTNRLNRAWIVCGLAIRHALTLGLHVRQIAKEISDVEKEHRVRLWWSLYTLECSLNELTGRPSCISDRDISTPLPVNIDENDFHKQHSLYSRPGYIDGGGEEGNFANHRSTSDTRSASSSGSQPIASASKRSYLSLTEIISSEKKVGSHILAERSRQGETLPLGYVFPVLALPITSSTYFIYRTQLAIVSHESVTQLYSAATIKTKWSDVQETIRRIDYRLLAWREDLPKEFDISFDTTPEPNWGDPYLPARTGLAMLFNSSRMILFRPCLCRFEGRLARQSSKSKDFNQDAVMTCIRSARKMIALMRWSADSAEKLYAINPWWTTLHYLCEALSVLMLELAFQAQHLPDEASHIFQDAKEGIRWLSMMSDQSVSARKAWEIYDSLIRLVATTINFSTDDMPNEAPVPLGYNWRRFSNAAAASHLAASDQQLTSANLQQYSGTHVTQHHTAATSVWATGTQDPMIHGIESFPSHPPSEMVPNPLDHTTALHHFSTFSLPHGHYDEPWQQYFVSDAGMTFSTTETSNGNIGDVSMTGMSEQDSYFGQLGFTVPGGFAGQGERGYGNIPNTTGGGTMYDPPSAYGPSAAYHDSRDQKSRRDSQMGEEQGGGVAGGDGASGNRPGFEPLRFREY